MLWPVSLVLWPVSRPVRLLLLVHRWQVDFRIVLAAVTPQHGLLPALQLGLHPVDDLRVLAARSVCLRQIGRQIVELLLVAAGLTSL